MRINQADFQLLENLQSRCAFFYLACSRFENYIPGLFNA